MTSPTRPAGPAPALYPPTYPPASTISDATAFHVRAHGLERVAEIALRQAAAAFSEDAFRTEPEGVRLVLDIVDRAARLLRVLQSDLEGREV